jgi:aromatic-L-amino-acid/L-tryptophan decarboxylase
MTTDELRQQHAEIGAAVTKLISERAASLESLPVAPSATPDELKKLFNEPLPQDGLAAKTILDQFARDVAPHAMQVPSPRYFGQFNPAPLAIGVWADALCELIGYGPQAFGVLASGGSEANLIALKCARDRVSPEIAHSGARDGSNLTVYTSEQCHYSVEKSLDIIGLGRDSLRKIPTDERFHVRVDKLQEAIASDIDAGRRPFCIVGVAGTTATGVIDDLPALADIAREHDCWFHVDAAYGGALAFSAKHKSKLRGIAVADSVTFDPHKWMFVPFSCGATLVRDGHRILRNSFDMSPDYLAEDRGFDDAQYDFFRYGQMGTRRFNSLKLWMCFKFMGKHGYSKSVENHIELTKYLAARLDTSPDFERVGEVETAVCCFRYLPERVQAMSPAEQDNVQQALQQRIEKSGRAFFPSTVLHGRRALRVNINSYLTEQRHVDELVQLLVSEGTALT